jgi:peptidoglycan/LPS O-acetylase OafA/YrhL
MSGSSLALNNLRAVVILVVLAFHSVLAYLGSLPVEVPGFDSPPFRWRSSPIVDGERWFGFDLFCAWQDVFLMSLFVFLSGLFVWSSLARKGARGFLADRLLRLGVPFVLVVGFLMPIAHYPSYLQTAVDPGIPAYWEHFLGLPFWPTGPAWFLQVLVVAGAAAAALHRFARPWGEALARFSASVEQRPVRYFAVMLAAAILAYLPLALAYGPWEWTQLGPFTCQLCRPLHYAFYFFVGLGAGAYGIERGLLAADGLLVRRWRTWLAGAVASMIVWLAVTAQTFGRNDPVPLGLNVAVAVSFVVACGVSCLFVVALCLRFGRTSRPALDSLKDCAYGMYLIHYVFVVWLQYLMLAAPFPAIVKAAVVFAGTLLASWSVVAAAIRRLPQVAHVIGADRRMLAKASLRATVPHR